MKEDELLEAIKGIASEGAKLTAIEEGLKAYGIKPIDSVLDRDTALKFIEGNPHLQGALDSRISSGVDAYKKRFNDEELPSLKTSIRQELFKELNKEPSESEKLQAQIDEMKQQQLNREKAQAVNGELLKTFDSLKASTLGFTVEDLTAFAPLGDNAVETFAKIQGRFSEILKASNEEVLKGKYAGAAPKTTDEPVERDNWKNINTSWMDK